MEHHTPEGDARQRDSAKRSDAIDSDGGSRAKTSRAGRQKSKIALGDHHQQQDPHKERDQAAQIRL
jgi:hypothetical protein